MNPDIIYQDGVNLDQYTILFNKTDTKDQAIVNIRFSPKYMDQLIEFEVEMNQILFSEGRGKDLTVNWKMYDGFDAKG